MYFVNHPDGVRQVLQTNHKAYGKRTIQYDALALVTGRGLLTNDGDSWLRQRRLTQPAFHPQRLAELEHHVAVAAAAARRRVEPAAATVTWWTLMRR